MLRTSSGNTRSLRIIKYDSLFPEEKSTLRKYCLQNYNASGFDYFASSLRKMLFSSKKKETISPFVYEVISHLKKEGIHTLGIFRLPSDYYKCIELTNHICKNKKVDLSKYDIHVVANSLKKYIRETLDGLIPISVAKTLEKNFVEGAPSRNIEFLPFTLEEEKRKLIVELFSLFKEVDKYSEENLMNIDNILLIVPPTIFPKAVQRDIKAFMPFIKLMKELFKLDYEHVPLEFVNKNL